MKPTGLAYEYWDLIPRYIVRLEADDGNARITCGKLGSKIVWIAILPQYQGTIPPSNEELEEIKSNMNALAEWVSPIEGEPNSYLLHDDIMAIFKDKGIRTHNGYPQAHLRGPAILRDESPLQQ